MPFGITQGLKNTLATCVAVLSMFALLASALNTGPWSRQNVGSRCLFAASDPTCL